MAKVPSLTARNVVRALKRAWFVEDRQEGSPLMLIHPETKARTVVPVHRGSKLLQLAEQPEPAPQLPAGQI